MTNLDFVKYHLGLTALMWTAPYAPGEAKFILSWPTTDVNITTLSGASFLARVREAVESFSEVGARPDFPCQVQHQFLLQQWCDMLAERGAHDTGISAIE